MGLEKEFPSTVSTIARTGAKLTPSDSIMKENRCVICLMYVAIAFKENFVEFLLELNFFRPYQENNKAWQDRIIVKTIPSLQKSNEQLQSSLCSKMTATSGGCVGCNNCNDTNNELVNNIEFMDLLCYACRVSMRDIKVSDNSKIILPPYVAEEVEETKKINNRKQMRQRIEEYLLCSEEEP